MNITTRAALGAGALALSALLIPLPLVGLVALAWIAVIIADMSLARTTPPLEQRVDRILARGVPAPLTLSVGDAGGRKVRVRQPRAPDVAVDPATADDHLQARITARRRGRHVLPSPAVRVDGPLRLGRRFSRFAKDKEILVYPDMPTAWRLAHSVRRSRYKESGQRTRGPLGLGTEFESIRDYLPDDDIRQVNWPATARTGRPMSNQYRIEQDRDVICLLDTGRLMAAPLDDRTRLDAAVDATAAVSLVADEVGDRCGALAFNVSVIRDVRPRRKGGHAVVQAIFDLEPTPTDTDYELAFRHVSGLKRSFVLVFTDLLEEAAARPLVDAVPVLARRHAVVIASSEDTDLRATVEQPPATPHDVYVTAVALDVLAARVRVAQQLRRAGAQVLEAPAARLASTCVDAYLRAKARALL